VDNSCVDFSVEQPIINFSDICHGDLRQIRISDLETNIISITPNPSEKYFNLQFSIAYTSNIIIDLYNLHGEKVQSIENGSFSKGYYNKKYQIDNLSAGIYYIIMTDGERKIDYPLIKL